MSKPPAKRRNLPKKPPTGKQLSDALGVSVRRITQLKTEGMPTHSIEAARRWREEHARTDSAEELRQRRIALLKQQERRTKIEADRTAGLLIPRAEVDERDTRIGFAMRAAIMSLQHTLPGVLAGLLACRMTGD